MNKLETPVGARAVAFDFGETLVTYAGTPLSWASLYRAALSDVAAVLGFMPTEEQFNTAETALLRYNTRVHPREREFPARHLFSEVLGGWSVYSEADYEMAIAAFFQFFQQHPSVKNGNLGRAVGRGHDRQQRCSNASGTTQKSR